MPRLARTLALVMLLIATVSTTAHADPLGALDLTLTAPANFTPGISTSVNGALRSTVTGLGVPGQRVEIHLDGALAQATTTDASGIFGTELVLDYPPAIHDVQAIVFPSVLLETRSPLRRVRARTNLLSVAIIGETGGTGYVSASRPGIACPGDCQEAFLEGTTLQLNATPAAGSTFVGWTGACTGMSPSCAITMDQDQVVSARFTGTGSGPTHPVTVQRLGEGSGSISSNPAGIDCGTACSSAFAEGTTVTLTATPDVGYAFMGWGGVCSGKGSCQFAVFAPLWISATFGPATRPLNVTVSGSGIGSVTSSPAGIACPGDCSDTFASNSTVLLTTAPASGSRFVGWGGDCAGAAPTCSLAVDSDLVVSANFSIAGVPAGGPAVALHIDPAHDGVQSSTNLSAPLGRAWQVDLPGTVSYPLIVDGKVFVTVAIIGTGSNLYAFDELTGAQIFSPVYIGRSGGIGLAYEDGRIFSVEYSGYMQATDADTGAVLWGVQLPGQRAFSSEPTALNGIVYTGGAGSGGTVYGVRASNGEVLWTGSVRNGDSSSPAVSSTGMYVSYACGQAYRFHPVTGALMWHHDSSCSGGGGKTSSLIGDRFYMRDNSQGNRILDTGTGLEVGTFGATALPALDASGGYFLEGTTLNARTPGGSLRWSFIGDGTLGSAPVAGNGLVYLAGNSGALYALDASTGTAVWSDNVGVTAGSSHRGLALGDGLLGVPMGSRLTIYR